MDGNGASVSLQAYLAYMIYWHGISHIVSVAIVIIGLDRFWPPTSMTGAYTHGYMDTYVCAWVALIHTYIYIYMRAMWRCIRG